MNKSDRSGNRRMLNPISCEKNSAWKLYVLVESRMASAHNMAGMYGAFKRFVPSEWIWVLAVVGCCHGSSSYGSVREVKENQAKP